ncbi:MAG: hypothetical protein H8E73_10500 [Planctomycetes bacterium]|nr:hypothetical protein [Planctomycetota bacterium]
MKNAIILSLDLSVLLALARPVYCAIVSDHTCLEIEADGSLVEIIPQAYLDQARQLKVLFCHASVGGTIMNGMVGRNGLANENPERYQIGRQQNADATWFDANTGIIDISHTGWPLNGSKILGFDNHIRNLGYGAPLRANVAFMKYCYIDWQPGTNVEQKWNEYRITMEALEADFSDITFVWWTIAVNTAGGAGDVREAFDNMLREYCINNGKVLFDLADIESHDLQGNPCYDDIGAEGLYAGYAVDGAHPRGIGQLRLASAMWWLLARIAGWEVGPARIKVTPESDVLGANGTATTQLAARLYDERNGVFIEVPERQITFGLSGPGGLISPTTVTTTNGRATVTYQAGTSTGPATITAASPGLTDGSADISLFANNAPEPPTNLLCDGQTNPPTLPNALPELTWTFNDPDAGWGDTQSAYRLIVADNPADIDSNVGNVWDTGRVLSGPASASPCVLPLRPGPAYYWKAKTWDISDEEGPFSNYTTFSFANGFGYAIELDPAEGSVSFGKDPSLDLHSSAGLTIEMWLYRTEENIESVILDKFIWGAGGYRVGVDASNYLYFRTRGERKGDRRVVALDAELHKGQWRHIACCQLGQSGGDDGVIYVDGIECGRNGLIYNPWPTNADLCLQQSGVLIDELRLSDTARYTSDFAPPHEPFTADEYTVGLWHFDEGEGTIAEDASGHNNTGTISSNHRWAAGYCACSPPYQPTSPDLTGNGTSDFHDFSLFAEKWLQKGCRIPVDLNNDMVVDMADLHDLIEYWLSENEPFL